jgi:YegS/Rv2252/BmrU family lipid kinase
MIGVSPKDRFMAIVNPAAGGGRAAKLAGPDLARLREKKLHVDVIASTGPRHAAQLAREAYAQGYRRFLAVGGDGTAHEIINGIYGRAGNTERVALGFLPFGTGNSFLRDFSQDGAEAALQAILAGRTRRVDLLRLTHAQGRILSFNLLSMGFTAEVGALANRRFKSFGHLGYLFGVIFGVLRLHRLVFKLRCDDDPEWDERRSLFLAFNNSKYTGGTMLIAPDADPSDGLIEYVRWGPIGRLDLLRTLPKLYDGSHIKHPMASRRSVKRVEFDVPVPIDVMIDGEIITLECRSLDVVPGAIDVYI